MENQFLILNSIYQPIQEYLQNLLKAIKVLGFNYSWNCYNNHSVKKDKEWAIEYYPIPVITIKDLCDIGIDIDHIFIEYKMSRDLAINFDWRKISIHQFEVYGVKDYLSDFYNATSSLETISTKISQSEEQEIAIAFKLGFLDNLSMVTNLIKLLHMIKENESWVE